MIFGRKLMQVYFDFVYNPVYDFTIAQTSPYHRLQAVCIDKFTLEDGDKVLCVGVGTGNEILRILEKNSNVKIWGVDSSSVALRRAYRRVSKNYGELGVFRMDAHRLDFDDKSFDKVLCIHLMGFLSDDKKATAEIIRVLRSGGQFVITYPSGRVEFKLGTELSQNIWHNLKSGRLGKATMETLAAIGGAIVNIPIALLWEKPELGFYSYDELVTMFTNLNVGDFQIEKDSAYQEFILFGKK